MKSTSILLKIADLRNLNQIEMRGVCGGNSAFGGHNQKPTEQTA